MNKLDVKKLQNKKQILKIGELTQEIKFYQKNIKNIKRYYISSISLFYIFCIYFLNSAFKPFSNSAIIESIIEFISSSCKVLFLSLKIKL